MQFADVIGAKAWNAQQLEHSGGQSLAQAIKKGIMPRLVKFGDNCSQRVADPEDFLQASLLDELWQGCCCETKIVRSRL